VEPTHKLDVLGHYCPVPVSQARKALADLANGDVLLVVADDPETMHDMPILVDRLGHRLVDVLKSTGEFRFIIEVCE
jgi:tRNA 2-thiouridine synthesizing protein A